MGLDALIQQGRTLLTGNSHTVLSAMGVAGTIGTAYLTGKAGFKACEILTEEQMKRWEEAKASELAGKEAEFLEITPKEKIQLVWKHYIPPVVVGTATVISIVAANHVASKKIAALVVASGVTERAFQEYKDKVIEKIRSAENDVNLEILHHMYCSLSTFYDKIGLPPNGWSDTVGFNIDRKCEVKITTTMSPDNRPCADVDFHFLPVIEYAKLYS